MKQYEMLHEVYNMCDVTKILNSSIEEVETDDLDQYVHSRFPGKNVQIERGAKRTAPLCLTWSSPASGSAFLSTSCNPFFTQVMGQKPRLGG